MFYSLKNNNKTTNFAVNAKTLRTVGTLSIICFSLLTAVHANSAVINSDKFNANYFIKYAPQTLYDMLQNTPGANSLLVELERSSQNRGFGSSGDQILINNQRLSGKENSIDKELENIQARDVEYIEVIRGSNSELAVQSKGVVVNVILKEASDNSLLWSLGVEKVETLSPEMTGSAFFSHRNGALKYRMGIVQEASPLAIERKEQHFLPNKQHSLTRDYKEARDLIRRRVNGKVEYQLTSNTDIQVNALYEKFYMDRILNKQTNTLQTNTISFDTTFFDYNRDKWEIGGDINVKTTNNNELRLLFISNETDANEKVWLTSALTKQNQSLIYQLPRKYITTENIVRGNWKYKLNNAHSFGSGIEAAINKRDEELQLIRSNRNYHSIESNDIKENRYEVFVNYNFTFAADLNLQSSLIYENSTMDVATNINIRGDNTSQIKANTSRTFNYLKPRVNLRYDIDNAHQVRLNYEKTASQLSLRDFVPWYNQFEDRLEQVNPNLEPEVRDEYSLTVEKKWQSTTGSVSLTPYYHDISKLITELPLDEQSGDGNIDHAKEYGVILKTHFGLDYFGFDNTLISASYTKRDSEMSHPFTGLPAPIERVAENLWDVKVNQNELLPGLSISANLSNKSPYQFNYYTYQGRVTSDLTLNAYIDYKISDQLKLRFSGEDLLNRQYTVFKDRHQGHFAKTEFLRHEVRTNAFSPNYSLTLTGLF